MSKRWDGLFRLLWTEALFILNIFDPFNVRRMEMRLVFCSIAFAVSLGAASAQQNEFIEPMVDMAGDAVLDALHSKIEGDVESIVKFVDDIDLEYRDRMLRRFQFDPPPLSDPTIRQAADQLVAHERFIGRMQSNIEEAERDIQKIEQIAQAAEGSAEMFERVARVMLPAMPTESYEYYKTAFVDADELQTSAASALGNAKAYVSRLVEDLDSEKTKLGRYKGWVEPILATGKKCGTLKRPATCVKKDRGTFSPGISGGGGGVIQ